MRALGLLLLLLPAPQAAEQPDRSPQDLALTPDGRFALTANRTSDSVSLVDLAAGKVVAEVPVGRRPFSVAVAADGKRAVVTNWLSDSLSVLSVEPPQIAVTATIPVGDEPRGVALSPDGAKAFVALAGEDAVAAVDLRAGKVAARAAVGREPWSVGLTPDGARLAVAQALSRNMSVLDAGSLQALWTVPLGGPNLRKIGISPDGEWAYVPSVSEKGGATTLKNIERGLVIANRLNRVPLRKEGPREALAVDQQGFGAADLEAVAVGPGGQTLAVSVGATRDILLLRLPLPFTAKAEPGEIIDPKLYNDKARYRRVHIRGRPVGLAFTPDGKSVIVANYLSNELNVLDFATGQETRRIPLGGPQKPSLARRGESIFYDGFRSWHEWYSCHSCHTEGHTNGSSYDTMNDGKFGNPKKVPSLRGVTRTGPWTWHGWQNDLRDSVLNSIKQTMQDQEPVTKEDLDAVHAFLETLEFPPSPRRAADGSLSAAARRGEVVFERKGCNSCHVPPDYTRAKVYKIGLESKDDAYKGFNPPPLRGVWNRAPYLHDGRAATLEEVLLKHHKPSTVSGEPDLSAEELADLVEFLKSL